MPFEIEQWFDAEPRRSQTSEMVRFSRAFNESWCADQFSCSILTPNEAGPGGPAGLGWCHIHGEPVPAGSRIEVRWREGFEIVHDRELIAGNRQWLATRGARFEFVEPVSLEIACERLASRNETFIDRIRRKEKELDYLQEELKHLRMIVGWGRGEEKSPA